MIELIIEDGKRGAWGEPALRESSWTGGDSKTGKRSTGAGRVGRPGGAEGGLQA